MAKFGDVSGRYWDSCAGTRQRRPPDRSKDSANLFARAATRVAPPSTAAAEDALLNTLETPPAIAWDWVCVAETSTVASSRQDRRRLIVMAIVAGQCGSNRMALASEGILIPHCTTRSGLADCLQLQAEC